MRIIKTPTTLLKSYLDAEQKACLREHGHFFVTTWERRVFCLPDGQYVVEMYEGKPETIHHVWACGTRDGFYTRTALSKDASRLMQMLMLRHDPDELIGAACHNEMSPGQVRHFIEWCNGCPPMSGSRRAPA